MRVPSSELGRALGVLLGCMSCVCECGGMCYRGVREGCPVLFERAVQLFGVGK